MVRISYKEDEAKSFMQSVKTMFINIEHSLDFTKKFKLENKTQNKFFTF